MLLVVAESSGSSPGRQGYKMAIGADGEMIGSIGGGVMEVNLVEESRRLLSGSPALAGGFREQVHRKDVANSSGMICSGKQTVIFRRLSQADAATVDSVIGSLQTKEPSILTISSSELILSQDKNPPATADSTDFSASETEFIYH